MRFGELPIAASPGPDLSAQQVAAIFFVAAMRHRLEGFPPRDQPAGWQSVPPLRACDRL